MISDTLCHAVCQIEDYQRTMPDVYGPFEQEIEIVKTVMIGLRVVLDSPSNLQEMRLAIRGTDTAAIRYAYDNILAAAKLARQQA